MPASKKKAASKKKPATASAKRKPAAASAKRKPAAASAKRKPASSSSKKKPAAASAKRKPATASAKRKQESDEKKERAPSLLKLQQQHAAILMKGMTNTQRNLVLTHAKAMAERDAYGSMTPAAQATTRSLKSCDGGLINAKSRQVSVAQLALQDFQRDNKIRPGKMTAAEAADWQKSKPSYMKEAKAQAKSMQKERDSEAKDKADKYYEATHIFGDAMYNATSKKGSKEKRASNVAAYGDFVAGLKPGKARAASKKATGSKKASTGSKKKKAATGSKKKKAPASAGKSSIRVSAADEDEDAEADESGVPEDEEEE